MLQMLHSVSSPLVTIILMLLSSGLWSILSVGILVAGNEALCNLHATFEGLCYCELRLPLLVRKNREVA